ncbi:MAG TPA: nucleotidyltransferase domain-containing protein [Pedobacter sp.]|nr:nucleotidyltransferase domain-containing protein [Pedobacter sp.]
MEEFRVAYQRIYNRVKDISEDIVGQGSRAAGTASASSDIDFAIRVNSKEFDQLIVKSFGNPKEGTAKWKTMQNAIKTGKIQSGEAGLRSLRKNLEKLLDKDVDISVIKKGGEFDNGIVIPVKK